MKNINLVLVAIILAGVFYLSFTEKAPAKPEGMQEVMYVEINRDQIAVLKGSEPLRTIEFPKNAVSSKKLLIGDETDKGEYNNGEVIRQFFQSQYEQGWEIESVVQLTTANHYYILRKGN